MGSVRNSSSVSRGKRRVETGESRLRGDSLARAGSVLGKGRLQDNVWWFGNRSAGCPRKHRGAPLVFIPGPVLNKLSHGRGGRVPPAHTAAPPALRRVALHLDDMPPRVIPSRTSPSRASTGNPSLPSQTRSIVMSYPRGSSKATTVLDEAQGLCRPGASGMPRWHDHVHGPCRRGKWCVSTGQKGRAQVPGSGCLPEPAHRLAWIIEQAGLQPTQSQGSGPGRRAPICADEMDIAQSLENVDSLTAE